MVYDVDQGGQKLACWPGPARLCHGNLTEMRTSVYVYFAYSYIRNSI